MIKKLKQNYFVLTDPPKVYLKPGRSVDLSHVQEGDDVYFECSVEASPRISSVQWFMDVSDEFT